MLASPLVQSLASLGVSCQAAVAQTATHISALPLELLQHVFRLAVAHLLVPLLHLKADISFHRVQDLREIERLGRVCRAFYLCSRDPLLWKMAAERIWGSRQSSIAWHDWRHMCIDRPRIFFHGVYISKSSYIREGEAVRGT